MIIELCCGIGRFNTDEDYITIDIDRTVIPTICADIRWLPLRPGLKPKLLHCSPPCTYVSEARRWAYGWNPEGVAETLRLLAACYDACVYLEPETFTLENPTGIVSALGRKVIFHYDKKDIYQIGSNFFSNIQCKYRATWNKSCYSWTDWRRQLGKWIDDLTVCFVKAVSLRFRNARCLDCSSDEFSVSYQFGDIGQDFFDLLLSFLSFNIRGIILDYEKNITQFNEFL